MLRKFLNAVREQILKVAEEPPKDSRTYVFHVELLNNMVIDVDKRFSWTVNEYYDYVKEGYLKYRVLKYQKKLALEGFRKDEVYYSPASIRFVTFEEKSWDTKS